MPNDMHFGVVVGIDPYPDLTPLNRAAGDADAFADWLVDPQGGDLPPNNVEKLVYAVGAIPAGSTRAAAIPKMHQVFDALQAFHARIEELRDENPVAWQQSRLYLFTAGHGIAPAHDDTALLMADAGPDNFGNNVSYKGLLAFYGTSQLFREVVMFADCCRDRQLLVHPSIPPWKFRDENRGGMIDVIGFAAPYAGKAYEPPTAPGTVDDLRGYFTRALLEGLRGKAVDRNGQIDAHGLADYVRERVRELTNHLAEPQEPTFRFDAGKRVVFRTGLTNDQDQTVRLIFSTPHSGAVELLGEGARPVDRHDPSDGPWELRLRNGLYRVVTAGTTASPFRNGGYFTVLGEDHDVNL